LVLVVMVPQEIQTLGMGQAVLTLSLAPLHQPVAVAALPILALMESMDFRVAQVAVERKLEQAAQAILHLHRQAKGTTAVAAEPHQAAAAADQVPLEVPAVEMMAAKQAMEPLHQFPVHLYFMRAEAVAPHTRQE